MVQHQAKKWNLNRIFNSANVRDTDTPGWKDDDEPTLQQLVTVQF